MWNHRRDLEIWKTIAQEAHRRHSQSTGLYIKSQSIVENSAHKLVAAKAASSRRVLEIGVGGGEHLAFKEPATGSGYYVGIDLSAAYARICRDTFGVAVATADVAALPFASASFDCVIAMSVLEHVCNLNVALGEVDRVLAPGGSLLVVVPTNGSLAVNAYRLLMTHPTMRRRGIARPDLVWHYLNVNSFKRVQSLLMQRFDKLDQIPVPLRWLPWRLSPLWFFHCRKR